MAILSRVNRCMLAVMVAVSTILIVIAGCSSKPDHSSTHVKDVSADAPNSYVGNDACADCHKLECELAARSGHLHSLRLMNDDDLGKQMPLVGLIPGTTMSLTKTLGRFGATNIITQNTAPLEYAFGMGKRGITFVSVLSDTELFEMRYSYFPELRKWYITPGHEQLPPDPRSLGERRSGSVARKCMACHSTSLPEYSLYPEIRFMGVGCESCHGPGGAHIAAARTRGSTSLQMDKLSSIGGRKMNELCGRCHRTVEEVLKMPAEQRVSQRLFTYGLAMSKCFLKSDNKMSCSTCHEPHDKPTSDVKFYESRCLQCHSKSPPAAVGADGTFRAPIRPPGTPILCKVNTVEGCIKCHMPRRRSFPGTELPIFMADHRIRAYAKGG